MDLPKRIKQHKAESDSYAILLYKLKDLGIFRNVTSSDYPKSSTIFLLRRKSY
jgi:hypothetical protein